MKIGIHPPYQKAKVSCACGNKFEVFSTVPEISVEICYNCHPLYTGTSKFVDTAGRVDRFKERLEKARKMKESRVGKKS